MIQAMTDERFQELSMFLDHWKVEHNDWVADHEQADPPETWRSAALAVCEAFSEGGLPAALRPVSTIVLDRLTPALARWNEIAEPHPSDEILAAYRDILAARQTADVARRFPRQVESITQIKALRPVPNDHQVARMLFGDSSPESMNKLKDEEKQPGCWTDRSDYITPAEMKARVADEQRQLRAKHHMNIVRHSIVKRSEQEAIVRGALAPKQRNTPESLEHLLALPGMTYKQAARMTGMSEAEVHSFAQGMGLAAEAPQPDDDATAQEHRKRRKAVLLLVREGKQLEEIKKATGESAQFINGQKTWAERNPDQVEIELR